MPRRAAPATCLLAAVLALASCGQDDLPRYVAGPVSGLALGCREAGQTAPAPMAYVTRADIDGDGKPDYIVDAGRGCDANRLLLCNDEGCAVDIFLTRWESTASLSFRAVSFAPATRSGRTVIDVKSGGPACRTMPEGLCRRALAFDGQDLAEVAGP